MPETLLCMGAAINMGQEAAQRQVVHSARKPGRERAGPIAKGRHASRNFRERIADAEAADSIVKAMTVQLHRLAVPTGRSESTSTSWRARLGCGINGQQRETCVWENESQDILHRKISTPYCSSTEFATGTEDKAVGTDPLWGPAGHGIFRNSM